MEEKAMSQLFYRKCAFITTAVTILGAASAFGSVTVNGTDDIFAAGQTSVPSLDLGGGTLPEMVLASAGEQFEFSATGTIASGADSTQNMIPPDGGEPNAQASINSPGGIDISGYEGPDHALTGVFLANSLPATTPTTLNFSPSGVGSSFLTLSPGLGQIFFIGDGLTGTGSGSVQTFNAPDGATRLFLGIPDFSGLGDPGSYYDNSGAFSVTVTTVPEPASGAMLMLGMMALLVWRPWHRMGRGCAVCD
jgi:hypothetical protein